MAEPAIAAYREAHRTMLSAPHSHGMAVTAMAVLTHGHKFLHQITEPHP